MTRLLQRLRNIPLFWKILLPFLALMLIVGSAGAFLIVNDQASRAQAALDQELTQRALQARAQLHDRELYLLESANFAANLQGMSDAVRTEDSHAAARLLQSVQALKKDLDLVVVTDSRLVGVSESFRQSNSPQASGGTATAWSGNSLVSDALSESRTSAGFLSLDGERVIAIATPICSGAQGCQPVGVAIVGSSATELAREAAASSGENGAVDESVALFDLHGDELAATAGRSERLSVPATVTAGQMVRQSGGSSTDPIATIYAPFSLQGRTAGTIALTVPAGPAFAAVRGTAMRLALVLLAAMAGIVGIGALISRFLLAQVRPLVVANRALGAGELSARVPVISHDELGELALGVNLMAEQLQASHETLELRVEERTQEVRRLLQERNEFFAGLSHELRTPLAIVIHQAEMLLEDTDQLDPRLAREVAQTVRDSATQLLGRVNDILQLAKAEAGGIELDLQPVDIASVVKDMRPMIDGLAKRAGLRTEVHLPSDLPSVKGDRTRLREVLMNLVDNAVKYTPKGGVVAISATRAGNEVEVSVSDTGVGIPRDEGNRIFEPFHRVKGTSTQGGQASSGLGLALAKTWVIAHGGQIGYESVPHQGTTFTFSLPITRRKRASVATTGGRHVRASGAKSRRANGELGALMVAPVRA